MLERLEEAVLFPRINGNIVKRYNLETNETTTNRLDLTFSKQTVFCMIDQENVLCIGGWPETNAVFLLNVFTSKLTPQRPTLTARGSPGVIHLGPNVYLFGGLDSQLQAMVNSEKYSIEAQAWAGLQDMYYPRSGFSPCHYEGVIYLIDVYQAHRVIESFNLSTEVCTPLSTALPSTLDNTSVSFVLEGELVVATCDKQVGRLLLGREATFRVESISMQHPTSGQSNIPPLVTQQTVLWVDWYTGQLVAFSPHTSSVEVSG